MNSSFVDAVADALLDGVGDERGECLALAKRTFCLARVVRGSTRRGGRVEVFIATNVSQLRCHAPARFFPSPAPGALLHPRTDAPPRLLLLAGCAIPTPWRDQHNYAESLKPAEVGASDAARASQLRVLKVRAYADSDPGADAALERAHRGAGPARQRYSGKEFGARLEIESVRPWPGLRQGSNLRDALADLEAQDPGKGVDWVVGFVFLAAHVLRRAESSAWPASSGGASSSAACSRRRRRRDRPRAAAALAGRARAVGPRTARAQGDGGLPARVGAHPGRVPRGSPHSLMAPTYGIAHPRSRKGRGAASWGWRSITATRRRAASAGRPLSRRSEALRHPGLGFRGPRRSAPRRHPARRGGRAAAGDAEAAGGRRAGPAKDPRAAHGPGLRPRRDAPPAHRRPAPGKRRSAGSVLLAGAGARRIRPGAALRLQGGGEAARRARRDPPRNRTRHVVRGAARGGGAAPSRAEAKSGPSPEGWLYLGALQLEAGACSSAESLRRARGQRQGRRADPRRVGADPASGWVSCASGCADAGAGIRVRGRGARGSQGSTSASSMPRGPPPPRCAPPFRACRPPRWWSAASTAAVARSSPSALPAPRRPRRLLGVLSAVRHWPARQRGGTVAGCRRGLQRAIAARRLRPAESGRASRPWPASSTTRPSCATCSSVSGRGSRPRCARRSGPRDGQRADACGRAHAPLAASAQRCAATIRLLLPQPGIDPDSW